MKFFRKLAITIAAVLIVVVVFTFVSGNATNMLQSMINWVAGLFGTTGPVLFT